MPSDTLATSQPEQQTTPAPAKRPPWRPTLYTPELTDRICTVVSQSAKSLATICAENPDFPCRDTIYDWLDRHPDFSYAFQRARQKQADFLAEQTLEIADDTSRDWEPILDGNGNVVGVRVDGEHVQARKLRIDTRARMAGKLHPKRWGDNLNVQVSIGEELRKLVREANAEPLDVTPKRIEDKT